jgi:hypothetical protein
MHTGSPSVFRGDWVCAVAWLLVSNLCYGERRISGIQECVHKTFELGSSTTQDSEALHAWLTTNTQEEDTIVIGTLLQLHHTYLT